MTVALIGNPNTGKTSLFNALTGYRRHVANYPGVTVDTGAGPVRGSKFPIQLLDLPGTYSLAAMSPDELLVCQILAGQISGQRRPDVVLAIADASNLRRNLYLLSQLLEVGLPVVLTLNMIDIAESRGLRIDVEALVARLGIPVIPVVATRSSTVAPLVMAIEHACKAPPPTASGELPPAVLKQVRAVQEQAGVPLSAAEAIRLLYDRDGAMREIYHTGPPSCEVIAQARERLREAELDNPAIEVQARYRWVNRMLEGVITRPDKPVKTWSDRIDRVLTHKVGGAVFLLAVLYVVFQAIFAWAGPLMESIDGLFGWVSELVARVLPDGAIQSAICDGVISGVGGVVIFLPQILILFLFIAVLEDCGYMARAAYMMDRLMRTIGLSGRAFIPLLSSFACAVPAIMGTRAIGDRRERFITILIAPYMSCSARLPVYVLLIAAFVPATAYLGGWVQLQALVMLAMYLVGVLVAIPVAWLLRKTAFAGVESGFMLELPSYKIPRWQAIWQRMYFAGKGFLLRAGTVILLVNLVVWVLGYFPRDEAVRAAVEQRAAAEQWSAEQIDAELAGAYLRESYLGRVGHVIEPVIEPIGWDWRIGVGVIASFPAREVIIATLGTLYDLGAGEDEASESLQGALQNATDSETGRRIFNLPVALSLMVFFALCAQCSATLVTIGRETGTWRWPVFSFVSMTLIAYFAAWGVAALARVVGL